MTHPLTPREKVAQIISGAKVRVEYDSVGRQYAFVRDAVGTADAILTALASGPGDQLSKNIGELKSGSGDHAELARLADMADWIAEGDPGANGSVLLSASVAAEHAADLKALLAENAALRANEKAVLKECADWARKAGDAIGKLETSEAAGIVQGWQERATEAERKLAEAVGLKHLTDGQIFAAINAAVTITRDRNGVDNGAVCISPEKFRTFLSKEAERGCPHSATASSTWAYKAAITSAGLSPNKARVASRALQSADQPASIVASSAVCA